MRTERTRSEAADLMFSDVREARARRIVADQCIHGQKAPGVSLDRVTAFVTHRCNLACRYCNGPHLRPHPRASVDQDLLRRELTPETYTELLGQWQAHGLRHIHFTGGEPTLNCHLPEFVERASRSGIMTSITTNGTASLETYRALADSGMTEIRISFDSHIQSDFDSIVGVPGTFARVDSLVRELVARRDCGQPAPFVILNACVDRFDVGLVEQTITGLLAYHPDDLKLLVVAQDAVEVRARASRDTVHRLLRAARSAASRSYPLLEQKILAMFRRNLFGLTDPDSRHVVEHCYIPLTERTLDSAGFYPCSIYLRYRGEALCPSIASFDDQQSAARKFSSEHDCREDPICSANCTSCCREFNISANRMVRQVRESQHSLSFPPLVPPEFTDARAPVVFDTISAIAATTPVHGGPMLIIRPLGMEHREEILAYVATQGLHPACLIDIPDWGDCSLYLYCKSRGTMSVLDVRKRLALNFAFRAMEPGGALALVFDPGVPVAKVHRVRADIRRWYPECMRELDWRGAVRTVTAYAVHTPDEADLWWERRVVAYFASTSPLPR